MNSSLEVQGSGYVGTDMHGPDSKVSFKELEFSKELQIDGLQLPVAIAQVSIFSFAAVVIGTNNSFSLETRIRVFEKSC